MKNKYVFVVVLLVVLLLAGVGLTKAYVAMEEDGSEEEITVVTSFYPMYIAAMNIIGDTKGVTLENLSEPQTGCLHDYQLTPADMKLLSGADIFVVNGGGIESFLSDVAEEYEQLQIVNACENLTLLEDNAHAWMNIADYREQVAAILQGLIAADPAHADAYQENAASYDKKLAVLQQEADKLKSELAGKDIIIFHEAYEYVADEYDMQVTYVMDLDEERQVSAGEVADVISQIDEHKVKVVLAEELYGKDMGDTVEAESDAKVYYLNTLVRGDYEADSYITGMEENIQILKEAFTQ